jgi:AcrR family transcriptional regulator
MIAQNDQLLARLTDADDDADSSTRRILEAALTLFGEFGLRRTTLEDVGRRAGVSLAGSPSGAGSTARTNSSRR